MPENLLLNGVFEQQSQTYFSWWGPKRKLEPCIQGSHRLEKYFNSEGFLEKSLKIKSALKSTEKKSL